MKHPLCPFTEHQVEKFRSHLLPMRTGCQHWTGARCGDYGRARINRKCWTAHRAAFVIAYGPIPDGLIVRHKCDNPICCNPEHLELGTYQQNTQDMIQRGRNCPPRGERSYQHRLTRVQVSHIKYAINEGLATQAELGRKYHVSHQTIHAIRCETTWATVQPAINDLIPQPHRKFTDIDHAVIRDRWREGWTLKQLAAEYSCRVDSIQSIISGKRGKLAPVGLRVIRQNKTKHTAEVRQEMLRRYLDGETQIALAKEYGMSKNGICLALQAERRLQSPVPAP